MNFILLGAFVSKFLLLLRKNTNFVYKAYWLREAKLLKRTLF